MTLTFEQILLGLLALAGTITALKPIGSFLVKLFNVIFRGRDWIEKQNSQTEDIEHLKEDTSRKLHELDQHYKAEVVEIKNEQTLMIYGILAGLKGLAEQGCDGPVHDAINKIEKYLNQKAHE